MATELIRRLAQNQLIQMEFSRFCRFFRGMSSVLTEQLLRDMAAIKSSRPTGGTDAVADDVDCRKLIYCLRRRGWLLLNALASSDLKVQPISRIL